MYQNFEQLLVWQKSMELSRGLIPFLNTNFPKYHPLVDQMVRSSVSVPSNIAEGSERNSQLEFLRFLHIAKGSLAELYTQLELSKSFVQVDAHLEIETFLNQSREISKMLFGLIKSIKENLKTKNPQSTKQPGNS